MTRRAYFSGFQKVDVLSPYLPAIFILPDVQESEIVCLADHLAIRRIRIHASLGKMGDHAENTRYTSLLFQHRTLTEHMSSRTSTA